MAKRNLALVVLFFGLRSLLYAQAFSVPISQKVVEMEIVLPNGQLAKVQARDGTMITIRDSRGGQGYAFVPAIDPASQQLSIMALELSPQDKSGEHVQFLNMLDNLALGTSFEFSPNGARFQLQPKGISIGYFPNAKPVDPKASIPNPRELRKVYGSGGGDCCVKCHSITICATSVTLDCGACNSGGGLAI